VTVIGASGFEDEAAASGWLERCRRKADERDELLDSALLVVNRALHGHRVAGFDPYVRDVNRSLAVSIRIGYGTGDEVVEGHWEDACEIAAAEPARSSQRKMLAPQEELAGILSGRSPVHPSDDLVLRARLDLDQGRREQAALQLRSGVEALEAEVGSADSPERQTALNAPSEETRALARAALEGKLDDSQVVALRETLAQIERFIRRRRYGRPSAD
jgi:hypothetical protein